MRRWILIFVVAVQAAVLITLSGPMGAMAATSNNFKGKASVYYRTPPPGSEYSPYFVVNFTCSSGKLSGNWTWDTSNETSYGGTLTASGCSLSGPPWSSGASMSTITLSSRRGDCHAEPGVFEYQGHRRKDLCPQHHHLRQQLQHGMHCDTNQWVG